MSDGLFFRKVADYFVLRRGRGLTLSSRDQQCLVEWSARGVHFLDAAAAIDAAFRELRAGPRSIAGCERWISVPKLDELMADGLVFDLGLPDASGAGLRTTASADDARTSHDVASVTPVFSPEERIVGCLDAWSARPELSPCVRAAAARLRVEFVARAARDGVSSELLSLLDDAFVLTTVSELEGASPGPLMARAQAEPERARMSFLRSELAAMGHALPVGRLLTVATETDR